jgi:hypothetical protein
MDTDRMLKQQPLFGGTDSLLHYVVLRHPIALLVFAPELEVESQSPFIKGLNNSHSCRGENLTMV